MKKETNTPAIVLGITTAVFVITTTYFFLGHRKLKTAIDEAGMEISEDGKLVAKK